MKALALASTLVLAAALASPAASVAAERHGGGYTRDRGHSGGDYRSSAGYAHGSRDYRPSHGGYRSSYGHYSYGPARRYYPRYGRGSSVYFYSAPYRYYYDDYYYDDTYYDGPCAYGYGYAYDRGYCAPPPPPVRYYRRARPHFGIVFRF